ncbi:MAG: family 20 glycosylhydrolase, partial [Rikenellaceae bacterium]|nr:family 20 glycosylhydrolase [Rikenellaceae bacterium]
GQPIACDRRADEYTINAVEEFATQLTKITGKEAEVFTTDNLPSAGVRFVVDGTLAEEGYKLEINKKGVEVRASTLRGFLYAIQTIKQLLPAEIYGLTPAPQLSWELPYVTIDDAPRFSYRAMHLDVARHFFPVEVVKRYLDMMAVHKLNTFHWHLTDDQGWRIEIERYPELTGIGSIRRRTVIRKEWDNYDYTPHGGYYTKDEIRDVVDYAAKMGIDIIPEIDLPGHMLAALAAYPHLGCTGGPYEVWGRWGVADEVLCAGNEEIFPFLEGVLTEVMELFPSEYIHIGGDECPKTYWEKCTKCQAKIAELGLVDDESFKAEHYLQSYVMVRIENFLKEHGRKVIGWDEILEGMKDSDATIMSWRGTEHGVTAARMGNDVIMVPTSHCYFDYYQSLDQEGEPFGIGGYVPIEKVYSFEPVPEGLTEEEAAHILGVQANIWVEYISEPEHLEYMLLPRLSALSEVQWCMPGVRDWERFMRNFRMDGIYTAMGYNFAKHIFGVSGDYTVDTGKGCVTVTLTTQGDAPIYYTLDGTEPTAASGTLYAGPVDINESAILKAAAGRENMETRVFEREFRFCKSTCRPIVFNSEPTQRHTYGGALSLVDGFYGKPGYTTGGWVGFNIEPLDVTIDMAGSEPYRSVALETLVDMEEWVFHPSSLTVYTSEDGAEFTRAAHLDIPLMPSDPKWGVRNFSVEFEPTAARYLRVVARPVDPIPSWHGAAGEKGHMFASEITVE